MSKVTAQTNTNINNRQNNSESKSDRATSKLFYHNGTHKMVFVDKANGDKEYIYDENGSKLYLEDYAILQMQNDRINLKNKLLSGLDKRQESREKQKAKWFEKYNLENKKYDLFTVAKQAAHKGYMSILNKTNCSTLSELQEFTRLNGGDYLKQAQAFLTERSNARSGQIKSESMSFFYGRMFVDESSSISEIQYQKIIAQSIFEC